MAKGRAYCCFCLILVGVVIMFLLGFWWGKDGLMTAPAPYWSVRAIRRFRTGRLNELLTNSSLKQLASSAVAHSPQPVVFPGRAMRLQCFGRVVLALGLTMNTLWLIQCTVDYLSNRQHQLASITVFSRIISLAGVYLESDKFNQPTKNTKGPRTNLLIVGLGFDHGPPI